MEGYLVTFDFEVDGGVLVFMRTHLVRDSPKIQSIGIILCRKTMWQMSITFEDVVNALLGILYTQVFLVVLEFEPRASLLLSRDSHLNHTFIPFNF
jgi:hypothetical protein